MTTLSVALVSLFGGFLLGIAATDYLDREALWRSPDPPLPTTIHVLPCSYGIASRVCVFERVDEARYSEEVK